MLTDSQLKNPLTHACTRAGLRSISWHVSRHTFASRPRDAWGDAQGHSCLLGHSSIVMTMRYAQLAPEVSGVVEDRA